MFPIHRMRRLRSTAQLRNLLQQHRVSVHDLICPIFVKHGLKGKQAIATLPGQFQFGLDTLAEEAKEIAALGISAVLLFGVPEHKDTMGSDSYSDNGIIQQAVKIVKDAVPELLVITDVCFCEYTDHSHCGVLKESSHGWDVDNDETLVLLGKQAVSHAKAGADMIAPSGMMDGAVRFIREALDAAGFIDTPIMSYAAKFASNLYGAFRDAAESGLSEGDRNSYQMQTTNMNEAMREVSYDVEEGADILMVKPASLYLDVVHAVKQRFPDYPLAIYHVGTEYAMIKQGVANGLFDEDKILLETFTSFKRAGADLLITYFAKDLAGLVNTN